MKLIDVKKILEATVLTSSPWEEKEVYSAFGCDLMSDVLAFVKDQALLLTGLVNPQVIRTAEMLDIGVVVFVRGKKPSEEMIELADKLGIIVLSTEKSLYLSSGLLFKEGLKANGEQEV